MDAILQTEREWFRAAALRLVTAKGVARARRVEEYHRRSPMPGAEFYPDMIAEAIRTQEIAA
jgi:hypothetical protein